MRGARVTLTTDVEALGTRHHTGDQGVVEEVHVDGDLTVRMDDGRRTFLGSEEWVIASQ
ncbi:hypothetical protein ABZ923_39130 [Streptomyces sp. NPDC046881]|uniref:hypothetical protein n=1 Tax=Streptomyces sp. NPDC046881 TaxID=3155374 RepID=UPI0034011B99